MDIDDLIGLELAGEGKDLVDAAAVGLRHLSGGWGGGGFHLIGAAMAAPKQRDSHDDNDRDRKENPPTLSHIQTFTNFLECRRSPGANDAETTGKKTLLFRARVNGAKERLAQVLRKNQ